MTSEHYTPTTVPWTLDRIREGFIYDGGEAEWHDPINGAKEQRRISGAIFDTWLAAHDARVAAATLRDAAEALVADTWLVPEETRMAHAYLTGRAVRIQRGASA